MAKKDQDIALEASQPSGLLASQQEERWYALYTRPRHEKAVAEQLARRHVETFLPVREVLSRWKDRRKLVQLPLFPGYVFTRTTLARKRDVVSMDGVVCMVNFHGVPAAIPDEQIEAVRDICLDRKSVV